MRFRYLLVLHIFIVLLFATGRTAAQLVGTNVFLQGNYLEIGVAANGSFGPASAPAGYHAGPGPNLAMVYDWGHDGWTTGTPAKFGDYVYPGTAFEGWAMQVNGARTDAFYTIGAGTGFWNASPGTSTLTGANASYAAGAGPVVCGTPGAPFVSGVWQGTAGAGGGLAIRQTTSIDQSASWVNVTTVFTNTTGAAMPGLYYWRTCDPDNEQTVSGSFNTINRISYQNDIDHRVLAGSNGGTYSQAYLGLGTKDCRAKVMIYSAWSPYPAETPANNLDLVYAGTASLGTTTYALGPVASGDIAIGLIYNLGTLAAGDSTIISYAYIYSDSLGLDSAFPEPQLVVNCIPVAPSGPAPAATIDTFRPCDFSLTSVPVSIKNATDKCWSWSTWNWAPATGLATTTGVNNVINVAALSGPTTYTITGTDSAANMYSCNHRVMYLTIIPCFSATNNGAICAGDTLKLFAHGDSTGATYVWHGPGIGGPVVGTTQYATVLGTTAASSGTYYVIKTVGGVSDTTSTDVIVHALPVITAGSNSPICSGNTLTLTSTPDSVGETWVWTGPGGYTSALSDPTRPSAPVSYSGVYTVVATLNGCSKKATVTVVIDSTPALPAISSNTPVCSGKTLTLTASDATPGVTYSWAGPGGFASGVQNPTITPVPMSANGIYTVTVTLGVCSNSNTTTVVVNPTPQPVLGSNAPVCSGNSLNLTETDTLTGTTFSWSGPNSFTSVAHNPSINPATTAATGTYSVVVTKNGCPSAVATIFAQVDTTPVAPVVSNNGPICSGDTLRLFASTATAGVTYSWSGPGLTSTVQNPVIPNAPVTAAGTYTVVVGAGTCTVSGTTLVVVKPTPVLPVVGSNSPVCSGNSLDLTASSTAGSSFFWNGPNSFSSVIQNPSINPATTAATGTYSVYAVLNGCISDTATIYAEVDSTPVMPLASSNSPGAPGPTICQGDTLKLFATDLTADVTYSWIGPNSFISSLQNPMILNVTPAASGPYTVIASLGACTSSAIITVTVTPTPPLTAGSNSPVCSGDTLKLTASSGTGAVFSWTGPYVFMSGAQNPTRYPAIKEYGGIYIVTVLLDGCYATVKDTVVVNQTPEPPVMAWLIYCQYYHAWPLQAYGENILWYPSAAGGVGSSIAPVPQTDTVKSTFYYATQTVLGCISRIDSMKVTVNPTPVINALQPVGVCPHDSIRVGASVVSGAATYRWYPDLYLSDTTGDTVVIRPETNQRYFAVAANSYNCKDTAAFDVTVYPNAIFSMPDSVTIYPGESYQIDPQSNCSAFRWTPAGGLTSAYISNPIATPEISTKYVVTGLTEWGCMTKDSIEIYVNKETDIVVPNAFAPGTGGNNEFKLIKRGIAALRNFRIYDRWGIVVFETKDIDKGWDGTYKGTPQPFGVYVYQFEAVTDAGKVITKKGNITLIR